MTGAAPVVLFAPTNIGGVSLYLLGLWSVLDDLTLGSAQENVDTLRALIGQLEALAESQLDSRYDGQHSLIVYSDVSIGNDQ